MDTILELLARIGALTADETAALLAALAPAALTERTDEELGQLDTALVAAFSALDEAGPTDDLPVTELAARLDQLVDSTEAVRGAAAERIATATAEQEAATAAAAEAESRREAARARLAGPAAEETPDVEEAPAAVAAAATRTPARTLGAMSTHRPAAAAPRTPAPTGPRVTTSLVASADVAGFATGAVIPDWQGVGKALAARLAGLGTYGGGRVEAEPVLVASLRYDYPAERRLTTEDTDLNSERIDAAFRSPDGLVAAGGLCMDLPVDYTIPEFGDLGRPFRDSLARFGADRGGIRTNVPPSLTQADAGIGFWTLANDVDPGGTGVPVDERLATKPVVEFDCGTPVSSYVYAVTLRTRYPNMRARFNPEVVASNARMGLVSHARLAELRLMQRVIALSTAVSAPALLGASKDFVANLDTLLAHKRYRTRTPMAAVHVWLPMWVRDMLRADFVRQMPAHNSPAEQYAVADSALATIMAARNVTVTWVLEDVDGPAGIGLAQPAGAMLDFPDTVRWIMAYEGELLYLDGGELDLGVVRDSALNAVNRYETFYESFEGVHFRGAEKPLVITSTLNPNGSAAGLVATATGNATADL